MLLLITIVVAIHLLGTLILIVAWFKAPEGYEDATGFHYGKEGHAPPQRPSYARPEPELGTRQPAFGMARAFRGSR